LQQAADYQPGDCLKERTHIFNLLSAHQKVWKRVRLNKSLATVCWCCFSQKFFNLLSEQTNAY
jgi:hypothetical protein